MVTRFLLKLCYVFYILDQNQTIANYHHLHPPPPPLAHFVPPSYLDRVNVVCALALCVGFVHRCEIKHVVRLTGSLVWPIWH